MANGKIESLNETAKNRNGYYKTFMAKGEKTLKINIEIIKRLDIKDL